MLFFLCSFETQAVIYNQFMNEERGEIKIIIHIKPQSKSLLGDDFKFSLEKKLYFGQK